MIAYGRQYIDEDDINSVLEVLQSDMLTQGKMVQKFEEDLKSYFNSRFSCAVANGTAALHLVGKALGWGKGDIVITTPLTFLATANCIVYCGATPDFVDIDNETFLIDPNQIEDKIKHHNQKGKKVKAVIGVDYAGYPCDWKALRSIANKYDVKLINDNCHAMGAKYQDDIHYALKFADIVTQSYHPVKHITTGEGGAVLTNDKELHNKILQLRTHGIIRGNDLVREIEEPWYYEMHEIGYNYRITDFQCALGASQLKKLDWFLEERRKIAKIYDSLLNDIEFLKIPKVEKQIEHAYHIYPVKINFKKFNFSKSDFYKKMINLNIKLQVHYIPIHLQPFYKTRFNFTIGDFPISEKFYEQEFSLPIYPGLKLDQVEYVVASIKDCLKD